MPTAPQFRRLFAIARRLGLDGDALHAAAAEQFGLDSLKKLTDGQYESLCTQLDRSRAVRRSSGSCLPAPGSCSSHPALLRLVETEGLPWDPTILTPTDVAWAADLLDDFRLYRSARGCLSVAQVRRCLADWGRHPLSTWRRAAEVWFAHYRRMNEKYFLGVLRGIARDARRAA
jgi:hypothetical protein